jgi:hypothetical protein
VLSVERVERADCAALVRDFDRWRMLASVGVARGLLDARTVRILTKLSDAAQAAMEG